MSLKMNSTSLIYPVTPQHSSTDIYTYIYLKSPPKVWGAFAGAEAWKWLPHGAENPKSPVHPAAVQALPGSFSKFWSKDWRTARETPKGAQMHHDVIGKQGGKYTSQKH